MACNRRSAVRANQPSDSLTRYCCKGSHAIDKEPFAQKNHPFQKDGLMIAFVEEKCWLAR